MLRGTRGTNSTRSSAREPGREQFKLSELRRDYDFVRKDRLDDDITFSRSSGATQTNSSGLVAYAPNNILTSSEDIVNDWTQRGSVSVTAGQSDPDGGTTAYLFEGVIGAGLGDVYNNVSGLQGEAPYVVSFYIKKVTSTGTLYINSPQTAGYGQWSVDLSKIGIGWERITPSHSAVTVVHPHKVYVNAGCIHIYSGADLDFYFWHPQIERSFSSSDEPNDYISTGSGGVVHKERFDYDKDGNSKGLLIEEARTNLFTNSDFSSGWAWYNSLNPAPILNAGTDPSGGNNAVKIINDSGNELKLLRPSTNPTATTDNTYCASVYGKDAGARYLVFYLSDSASRKLHVDVQTGQIASFNGSGGYGVEEVGNDWYRVWFSHTMTAPMDSIRIVPSNSSYASRLAGNGSDGL